jgi:hypothetical protein
VKRETNGTIDSDLHDRSDQIFIAVCICDICNAVNNVTPVPTSTLNEYYDDLVILIDDDSSHLLLLVLMMMIMMMIQIVMQLS